MDFDDDKMRGMKQSQNNPSFVTPNSNTPPPDLLTLVSSSHPRNSPALNSTPIPSFATPPQPLNSPNANGLLSLRSSTLESNDILTSPLDTLSFEKKELTPPTISQEKPVNISNTNDVLALRSSLQSNSTPISYNPVAAPTNLINVPLQQKSLSPLIDSPQKEKEEPVSITSSEPGLAKLNPEPSTKEEVQTTPGVDIDFLMKQIGNEKIEEEIKTKKDNKLFMVLAIGSAIAFVIVLAVALFSKGNIFNFRGSTVYYQDKTVENTGMYQTAVVTDNVYTGVSIDDEDDAKALIIKDANNQKAKCDNIKVKEIESRIEKNYEITAVNLCEVDASFASEIEKTIQTVYEEFPQIRGYLTNLTLTNVPEYSDYIASFVSARLFAKSNTINTYPNVYKMSIFLNASYFLNLDYFNATISDSLSYGYFPKGATRYTIVAHEFGHYLSFLAEMKNTEPLDSLVLLTQGNYNKYSKLIENYNNGVFSQKIIDEAYDNYKRRNPSAFDDVLEFRSSISEYAIAMNGEGEYIWDETIAEAFHDYYINRSKAKPASREIVSVLKKYLS